MKVYKGFNNDIVPISYADWIYVESSFDKEIKNIIRNAGVQLNEEILDAKAVGDDLMNIILKNPTRRELRDNKMNTCRGALGRNGNFYFISMSDLAHCDLFDTLEKMGIDERPYHVFKYSNKTNTFYYYDPDNDLDEEEIKKELESSPHFKSFAGCHFDYFDDPDFDPDLYESYNPLNESVKLVGNQLNEELIHAEKSNYDDYMAVVLKNPTKRELRENGLDRSRFICFEDGTWLFFDSMQWIHAHIWDKYKDKFNGSNNMGFYDLSNNEFIFIESLDYDEDEEGYEEEFKHYIDKETKFLLSYPYIVKTFGKDFDIMIYGDWVDNPW